MKPSEAGGGDAKGRTMSDAKPLTPTEEKLVRDYVGDAHERRREGLSADGIEDRLLATIDAARAEVERLTIALDEVAAAFERGWNKDAHALRTLLAEAQKDRDAYRAALGYSMPQEANGFLSDGTVPTCGMCDAKLKMLDDAIVQRDVRQQYGDRMKDERDAAQQENERLREALEAACQAMANAHYRLSNPTMGGEYVPMAKDGLKAAKEAARAALTSSQGVKP